jgi:hypothetical protein
MSHQKSETRKLLLRRIFEAATHAKGSSDKGDVSYTLDSHLYEGVYGRRL